ncbi:uncharacterized protein A4U43_C01F18020 [Asparagus officinalis]|uniref:RING-type domain-containing protein n=1 Tax=Asparagus officinalis TaxID=4686 RepID=A0A5P1FQ86_ASPOF|nr:uncharacterized protein LOC109842671 [Asparagus officinalis]ONK80466.1 uncharacterized protein A4U43_C01F18020 [Asparagus officinalis]
MGNKIGKMRLTRQVVDEEYTKPQGLYPPHKDTDYKQLRKLILDSKLAPCYPGLDECRAPHLDECPICFLYYPSLNRSRCCRKLICTECFLQIKPTRSSRAAKCPFCKTTNYLVEYRGTRTKEEKKMEQIEEQRVIEAQIRMQVQEIRDEEERIRKKKKISSPSTTVEVECQYIPNSRHRGSCSVPENTWVSESRHNMEDIFDMDLDDTMVYKPTWLPTEDQGTENNAPSSSRNFPRQTSSQDLYTPSATSPPEAWDSADSINSSSSSLTRVQNELVSSIPESWTEKLLNNRKSSPREYSGSDWRTNHEVSERGMGYATRLFPDSLEEQMMVAMAVSLDENRARSQGVTWLQ